jgi:pyruvate dehydrogenase E2 component (dihydrolipoamide acetyltransferase)
MDIVWYSPMTDLKGGDFMKKVVAIIVSVLFVLSVVGLSFAADDMKKAAPASTPAPAKMDENAAPAKAEKKAPAKVKQVSGEVAAVDAAAKTLTVKGKKGEVALTADDKAAAKLADVKVGDKVTVKYKEMDGKNVATSIAAKKAAKKTEKKEAAPMKEEKKAAPAPAAPAK